MALQSLLVFHNLVSLKPLMQWGQSVWISGNTLYYSIGFVALTMLIIWLLPKITKAVPATLAAILATSGLVLVLKIDIPSVEILQVLKEDYLYSQSQVFL